MSNRLVPLVCATVLFICGCGSHHHSQPAAAPAPEVVPLVAPYPTQCDVDEQKYTGRTDLNQNDAIQVTLERDFQNVIHQDCHGTVTSSGIETVKSPVEDISFRPNVKMPAVGAIHLFNDTACDSTNANFHLDEGIFSRWFENKISQDFNGIVGKSTGLIRFTVDASKGETTVHVKPGVNQIYYTYFDRCVPEDFLPREGVRFGKDCASSTAISSGSLIINVAYSEKNLPGDKVERESECPVRESMPRQ